MANDNTIDECFPNEYSSPFVREQCNLYEGIPEEPALGYVGISSWGIFAPISNTGPFLPLHLDEVWDHIDLYVE